jgi:hypothetical protein
MSVIGLLRRHTQPGHVANFLLLVPLTVWLSVFSSGRFPDGS